MSSLEKLTEQLNDIANNLETYIEDDLHMQSVEGYTKTLMEARDAADTVKFVNKRFADIHRKMKEDLVPAKFEEEGVSSITIDGYRFTVSKSMRTSIVTGQKEEAYIWLRDNELGDLIQETVNSSTLNATAKSLLEEGLELPEDHFSSYFYNNTSVSKK